MVGEFEHAFKLLTESSPSYWANKQGEIIEKTVRLLRPLRRRPQRIIIRETRKEIESLRIHWTLSYETFYPLTGSVAQRRIHDFQLPHYIRVYGRKIEVRKEIREAWDALITLIEQWQIPKVVARVKQTDDWTLVMWNSGDKIVYIHGDDVYEGQEICLGYFTEEGLQTLVDLAAEIAEAVKPVRDHNGQLIERLQHALRPHIIADSLER